MMSVLSVRRKTNSSKATKQCGFLATRGKTETKMTASCQLAGCDPHLVYSEKRTETQTMTFYQLAAMTYLFYSWIQSHQKGPAMSPSPPPCGLPTHRFRPLQALQKWDQSEYNARQRWSKFICKSKSIIASSCYGRVFKE